MENMIPVIVFGSTVVLVAIWIYASKKEDKGSIKSGKPQKD